MSDDYYMVILSKALKTKIDCDFFIQRLVQENGIPRDQLDYIIYQNKYRVLRKITMTEIHQCRYLYQYRWQKSIIESDKKVRNWQKKDRRRKCHK